jgi:uncharacterized membrane protein (UPF0127 family)
MPLPESKEVRFGGKTFKFSVSKTAYDMTKGLSGVASLEPLGIDGMLFDFGMDYPAIMTPRGLLFPIDIAFVSSAGLVLGIATMYPSYGHDVSMQGDACRYVLEAPLGFCEANGISVGQVLDLSGVRA